MRKHKFIIGLLAGMLCMAGAMGQRVVPRELYLKKSIYFDNMGKYFLPWNQEAMHQNMQGLQESIGLLKEDKPIKPIAMVPGGRKMWNDEDIFSRRKSGVFILTKMIAPDLKDASTLDFNPMATAFAISKDGICVTNYHVLKELLERKKGVANKDSVYFIVTTDKKIYLIDRVLAYSKNNDLAIFQINLHGDSLNPIPQGKPANVGAPVYCISHPMYHFYYFSKGMVSRNVAIANQEVCEGGYSANGRPPIRMEITADYSVGSSGGPILDKYGNLIGIVISTEPIYFTSKNAEGKDVIYEQMVVKDTAPVKALTDLLMQ